MCLSYVLGVLHSEDLLSEVLQVVKGGLSCDGVNQSKALTVLHVQVSHCCELLLYTQTHTRSQSKSDRQMDRVDSRSVMAMCLLFLLCPGSPACTAARPPPLAENTEEPRINLIYQHLNVQKDPKDVSPLSRVIVLTH